MSTDYLPGRESMLALWAVNFSTLISAAPTTYGLMPGDAAAIAASVNAFNNALTIALDPATKTKATVSDKNGKKAAMLVVVRPYAQTIKRNAGISNPVKVALGLTIDNTHPTPTPAPTTAPILSIIGATSLQQTLRFADSSTPAKRAKAQGTKGLMVYKAVGTVPPASPELASFYGMATKQPFAVNFGAADAGKTAYLWGRWMTASGLLGPWSSMVSMTVAQ